MDQLYHNYKRIALVAHSPEDLDAYRWRVQEVARYCERWNMRYEEILGSPDYFLRLLESTAELERIGKDFILVHPGGELRQEQFLRLGP